jgi:hypothetical protein
MGRAKRRYGNRNHCGPVSAKNRPGDPDSRFVVPRCGIEGGFIGWGDGTEAGGPALPLRHIVATSREYEPENRYRIVFGWRTRKKSCASEIPLDFRGSN